MVTLRLREDAGGRSLVKPEAVTSAQAHHHAPLPEISNAGQDIMNGFQCCPMALNV